MQRRFRYIDIRPDTKLTVVQGFMQVVMRGKQGVGGNVENSREGSHGVKVEREPGDLTSYLAV